MPNCANLTKAAAVGEGRRVDRHQTQMMKITPAEIQVVSKYVADTTGIFIDELKAYLIENRLGSLVKVHGFSSYSELCYGAKSDPTKSIEKKIIDAITTRETSFFRDINSFELLKHKILPDLIDKRTANPSRLLPTPIRIWSAACATGQEVYSIAIVLKELIGDPNRFSIKILGTDISDAAIDRARYGQYNMFEVERGLSKEKLQKYFIQNVNGWKIRDEIRALTTFKKQNLLEPFTLLGRFDIVFCRNVAIYFTTQGRSNLFNKIAEVVQPEGYLMIGGAESLIDICPRFEPERYLKSFFYRLKG